MAFKFGFGLKHFGSGGVIGRFVANWMLPFLQLGQTEGTSTADNKTALVYLNELLKEEAGLIKERARLEEDLRGIGSKWGRKLDENGVLWGLVQNYLEVTTDPQVLANEYITEVNHPTRGRVKILASPIQFSKTPSTIRTTAPELGQHTEEILLDIGYTREDIVQLKNERIII